MWPARLAAQLTMECGPQVVADGVVLRSATPHGVHLAVHQLVAARLPRLPFQVGVPRPCRVALRLRHSLLLAGILA